MIETNGSPQCTVVGLTTTACPLAGIMRSMAFDRDLADRISELVVGEEHVVEQRMFGGVAFLVNGNMAVAASGQGGLMVRVDPAGADRWIDGDRVTPMEMRGRPMRGWLRVLVDPEAQELEEWVSRGFAYARSLPPKTR
ncbi:TfoX/Sxy family protein [Terrabacter aeriphilus]|uniref:TfoX/Sxy family protein n=1 Tax=Terrabacter aeriphilus TaxID=515662 RepID=A0ABP9J0C4_9MICO